ncbi:MAG: hypothetical protein ACOCWC_00415 [Bacteroidota bacterium]
MDNFKISKNIPANMNNNHVELHLEGELSLQNTESLKKAIAKNIKGFDTVKITANNISQTDITFVQIIESLKKQYKEKISFKIEYPYDIKTLMQNAGFEV